MTGLTRCVGCGQDNPGGFAFCGRCGRPLDLPQTFPVRRTVTLVFTDVADSTATAGGRDPEAIRAVMDRYFAGMRAVLERHGGTVEKFVGDAVLAAFGTPIAHEDDALRAVRAAAEMREELNHLNDEFEADWGIRIAIRTGVNTGETVAGDPFSRETFATGDPVNTAARLEQAAGPGEILLGEPTYRLVRDAVSVESVQPLSLKGKSGSVPAWRLLSVSPAALGRARRLDAPLLGRAHELSALQKAFEKAITTATCQLVTVVGSAGVGKTRLVREFLDRIGDRSSVLRGRCLSYGEGITFWPVAEILKEAAGISEADPPGEVRRKLAGLTHGTGNAEAITRRLAGLLGADSSSASIEESFLAVRRTLESLASGGSLVVLVEDLHWAQPTLLDLIQYLAGGETNGSILLICTARPELTETRPEWGSGSRAEAIVLRPLEENDTDQLIEALLGPAELGELPSRIREIGGGNPLFVEEMLSMLIDDGILRMSGGRWRTVGPVADVPVPPTISALIAARLDRLAPGDRAAAERASVVGTEFESSQVAALVDRMDVERLPECLSTLERKEFLLRRATSDGWRFRHVLIRDEAYAGIAKMLRAELHERFADWLEDWVGARGAEYEEIIGYHLELSFRYRGELRPPTERDREIGSRAGDRLASAGRRALARGDLKAGSALLERAAGLWDRGDRRRVELLPDLGLAFTESGEFERAAMTLEEAIGDATRAGDNRSRAHAIINRLELQRLSQPIGWLAEAERVLPGLVADLDTVGDQRGLSRAWTLRAEAAGTHGRFAEREAAMMRAVDYAAASGDERAEGQAIALRASAVLWGPKPVDQAIEICRESLDRLRGRAAPEAHVRGSLGLLMTMKGQFEEARDMASRAEETWADLGLEMEIAGHAQVHGQIEMLANDPAAAEQVFRPAFEFLDGKGERSDADVLAAQLAGALYAQGRFDDARRFAEISREMSPIDDIAAQFKWRAALARVLAREGDVESALTLSSEAVDLAATTDFLDGKGDVLRERAEVLRLTGYVSQAAPALREALRCYAAKGNAVSAREVEAILRAGAG
jgi:class 3 adenylate cyclase/tetratricopeptide (TPR) repeat protein